MAVLLVGLVTGAGLAAPRVLDRLANPAGLAPLMAAEDPAVEQLAARRAEAVAHLNDYGWVDQESGVAHIPIDRAMALLAGKGLPVGPPPATPTPEGAAAAEEPPVDLTNVSFQNDVLPIFLDRCSKCHGDDEPEQGLVLMSYQDVMAGSFYGSVVKPGDPDNSYLVEMVVTGKMPNRGDDLTPTQIAIIIAWIEAGALDN